MIGFECWMNTRPVKQSNSLAPREEETCHKLPVSHSSQEMGRVSSNIKLYVYVFGLENKTALNE